MPVYTNLERFDSATFQLWFVCDTCGIESKRYRSYATALAEDSGWLGIIKPGKRTKQEWLKPPPPISSLDEWYCPEHNVDTRQKQKE